MLDSLSSCEYYVPMQTRTSSFELMVFDLDGTLIDSQTDIANAVNSTFAKYGLPILPHQTIEKYIGTGVAPLIRQTAIDAKISDINQVMDSFEQFYLKGMTDNTYIYDGVIEVLSYFMNTQKIILTNKSNKFLNPLIRHFGLDPYFTGVYGRESFTTSKPNPAGLKSIIELAELNVERCVMIGDTLVDLNTGKNAGALTCAVTYGYGGRDSLVDFRPNFLVDHPAQIMNLRI